MTTLVITNPSAARARGRLAALQAALPACASVTHHITERPDELLRLVGHDAWSPEDLLVINGGDGSVQHALTVLLRHCPVGRLPRVACLPGGTTNMTAFDINEQRRFGRCIAHLSQERLHPGSLADTPRPVVRVVTPGAAQPARCGLFFGIGTIVQGIEYFQVRRQVQRQERPQTPGEARPQAAEANGAPDRDPGRGLELGAGVALTRTLWGIARHEPPFAEVLHAALEAPGLLPAATGNDPATLATRLLLVTTLDRLFLGIRPYWGSGSGALRATLVERRGQPFIPRVPRLLRGRPDGRMTPEDGFHSARIDRLWVTFEGSYTLDGELFGNAGGRIAVTASHPVRFVPL